MYIIPCSKGCVCVCLTVSVSLCLCVLVLALEHSPYTSNLSGCFQCVYISELECEFVGFVDECILHL